MRVFLFWMIFSNQLLAQEFYSKLLSKEVFAEFAHGIIEVDDSSNLLQFRSSTDLTFNFGWMHIHQNGDTLSTFLLKENLVRPDGTNTMIMSGDTVFQLLKHRDSIHQIRVYATSLSGDSLLMRNYDWARPEWLTVYPRVLYRSSWRPDPAGPRFVSSIVSAPGCRSTRQSPFVRPPRICHSDAGNPAPPDPEAFRVPWLPPFCCCKTFI